MINSGEEWKDVCRATADRSDKLLQSMVIHSPSIHSLNKYSLKTCRGPSARLSSTCANKPALCPHGACSQEDWVRDEHLL